MRSIRRRTTQLIHPAPKNQQPKQKQGLEVHQGLKSQGELRRFGHRFFETEFGDKAKVADASNAAQV